MNFPSISIFHRQNFFDNRGFFSEIFSQKIPLETTFIQDNFSLSAKGVFRGFHFQKNFPQAKLITILRGISLHFMLDIRENFNTFGHIFFYKNSYISPKNIFIPRGFAHGFLALTDEVEIFYKVDNIYSPDDEAGFLLPENFLQEHFSDILQEHNISQIILSDKDKKLPQIPFSIKLGKL